MVECRRSPYGRRVALVAGVHKVARRMIRVRHLLVIRLMAHVTVRIGKLKIVIHMA